MTMIAMRYCCLLIVSLATTRRVSSFGVSQRSQSAMMRPTLTTEQSLINMSNDDNVISSAGDPFDDYMAGTSNELVIKDSIVGNGEEAKLGDVVTVKYQGRLLATDKEFDAGTFSFKLGEGKVIPGWEQGLQGGFKVGGKRSLKIPPSLAYGQRGAGDGVIPPNADLIFDCELTGLANGPIAETIATLGIGLNTRTLFSVLFILSIILPKFGIGDKGFI